MIKSIITDLFGVVVDWKGNFLVSELARIAKVSPEDLVNGWNADLEACECGGISQDDFFLSVSRKFNIDKKLLEKMFIEVFDRHANLDKEVVDVLAASKLPLILLSNAIPLHVELGRKKGWFDHFSRCCFSCEIHARKPAAEAYRAAINSKPSEFVFIDDKVENVEGAAKLGINAIHFTSPSQLRKELAKYINDR